MIYIIYPHLMIYISGKICMIQFLLLGGSRTIGMM